MNKSSIKHMLTHCPGDKEIIKDLTKITSADLILYPECCILEINPAPAEARELLQAKAHATKPHIELRRAARQLRAVTTMVIERYEKDATLHGFQFDVEVAQDGVLGIRDLTLQPPREVDAGLMNVAKDDFDGSVGEIAMVNGAPALQLGRLAEVGGGVGVGLDPEDEEAGVLGRPAKGVLVPRVSGSSTCVCHHIAFGPPRP